MGDNPLEQRAGSPAIEISEQLKNTLRDELSVACLSDRVDLSALAKLIEHARQNPGEKRVIADFLRDRFGKRVANLVESSRDYIQGLELLQDDLKSKVGQADGRTSEVTLMENPTLKHLVAIYELLGSEPSRLVKAFNLSEISPADEFRPRKEGDVIKVEMIRDKAVVTIEMHFDSNAGSASIKRAFYLTPERNQKASMLTADHENLDLPASMQGRDIGKELLKRSLDEYDELGIDRIVLIADCFVGAYAWAKYGFGWKKDWKEDRGDQYFVVQNAAAKALAVLKGLDTKAAEEARTQYQDFENNPEAVTPQHLAEAARDIQVVVRKSGEIILAESGQPETGDSKPMHLGKAAMLGLSWHGEMRTSLLGGKKTRGREMLEAYLSSK
ncbi:MAG: hypothetical protein V1821_04270 [bacterium]